MRQREVDAINYNINTRTFYKNFLQRFQFFDFLIYPFVLSFLLFLLVTVDISVAIRKRKKTYFFVFDIVLIFETTHCRCEYFFSILLTHAHICMRACVCACSSPTICEIILKCTCVSEQTPSSYRVPAAAAGMWD